MNRLLTLLACAALVSCAGPSVDGSAGSGLAEVDESHCNTVTAEAGERLSRIGRIDRNTITPIVDMFNEEYDRCTQAPNFVIQYLVALRMAGLRQKHNRVLSDWNSSQDLPLGVDPM